MTEMRWLDRVESWDEEPYLAQSMTRVLQYREVLERFPSGEARLATNWQDVPVVQEIT